MRRLAIADPCSASWEQMEGTARSRRCASCDREVHDLSARTELEATALLLVLGSTGLCVRYELDADGAMVHAPARRRPAPVGPTPRAVAGLMAAAAIGVAACGPAAAPPNTPSVDLGPSASLAVAAPEPETKAAEAPPATPVALVDTDKDGIADADDACPREPGNPSAEPNKNGCPFVGLITQGEIRVLEHIQFAEGGRTIDARGQALLDEVAKLLQQNPDIVKIAVQGHASSGERGAKQLAKARAEAVAAALNKLKIEPSRLVVEAYGVERPIADNATRAGREQNRRVEFAILEHQSQAQGAVASP